jgi:hypothetical protein
MSFLADILRDARPERRPASAPLPQAESEIAPPGGEPLAPEAERGTEATAGPAVVARPEVSSVPQAVRRSPASAALAASSPPIPPAPPAVSATSAPAGDSPVAPPPASPATTISAPAAAGTSSASAAEVPGARSTSEPPVQTGEAPPGEPLPPAPATEAESTERSGTQAEGGSSSEPVPRMDAAHLEAGLDESPAPAIREESLPSVAGQARQEAPARTPRVDPRVEASESRPSPATAADRPTVSERSAPTRGEGSPLLAHVHATVPPATAPSARRPPSGASSAPASDRPAPGSADRPAGSDRAAPSSGHPRAGSDRQPAEDAQAVRPSKPGPALASESEPPVRTPAGRLSTPTVEPRPGIEAAAEAAVTPGVQVERVVGRPVREEAPEVPRRRTLEPPPRGRPSARQEPPAPRVHIGQVEIVVTAPPAPQRPARPAARSDRASRRYLRRL